jgi:hypothetical protein
MESKEKLESFRFLAQLHRSQFDERRKYEWKIIFTILSFYVLAAALRLQNNLIMPPAWLVWVSFILLALLSSLFLALTHAAKFKSRAIAHRAESAILDILNETGSKVNLFEEHSPWLSYKCFERLKKSNQWEWYWQTIVILFFSIASALVISANI